MIAISGRLSEIEMNMVTEKEFQDFKESVDTFFFSEDEYSPINRLHDKLDTLLADKNRLEQVSLAESTLDKFEEYMKNVDKLNAMINEFKGCIDLARSVLAERKQQDKKGSSEGLVRLSDLNLAN
jgi:hypothetical protein